MTAKVDALKAALTPTADPPNNASLRIETLSDWLLAVIGDAGLTGTKFSTQESIAFFEWVGVQMAVTWEPGEFGGG